MPQSERKVSVKTGSRRRLAVVLTHPTQYYSPWFRWIRAHTSLNLRVFYLWNFGVTERRDPEFQANIVWDTDLLSGYDSEFIRNESRRPGAGRFFGFRNPGLIRAISRWEPDAILIFGYNSASHLKVIGWATLRRIPLLFRGDSHLLGRGGLGLFKRLSLRALYSAFDAFLYVGQANRAYFEYLHAPRRRLFFAPHSVDHSLYDPSSHHVRQAADAWRREIGVAPDEQIALFAGKLVSAKQPEELLEAFLQAPRHKWTLVFVGSGEREQRLREAAGRAPANARVIILPFANQTEMPARYLASDLFVLPSRGVYETWGLAVNEAMHMGVPCLVSDRVGCQRDLVVEGATGWVFDPEDPAGLGQALGRATTALADSSERARIKGLVANQIAGYSYAAAASALDSALGCVWQ